MRRSFTHMLARLRRSDAGVAAVEFALILPVMLAIYIGSIEASSLITMDRKIQSVAGAIGDLVARSDERIAAATLEDYFLAASGIMTPFSSQPVLQVVTSVTVSPSGEATVGWSYQYQNGAYSDSSPYADGDEYPLPAEMIAISLGRTVIAAEASYSYTPLYGIFFNQPVNLYRSSFYMPRFGGTITVNP